MLRVAFISLAMAAPLPALADTFVVLAYDRASVSYGFGIAEELDTAEAEAMSACSERGLACKIALTRSDVCVGLATDYTVGGWGTHTGTTAAEAETLAQEHCASFGNSQCRVVASTCPPVATLEMN